MAVPIREKGYALPSAGLWWNPPENEEETPELRWPLSLEIYDQMRRQDAQVMSVLRAVTLPIQRTTWRVDPAGAKATVTKFVADDLGLPILGKTPKPALRIANRFNWDEHLEHALLMLPFGHSFFEKVFYEPVFDKGLGRRVTHLRKLSWRPPRTISHIEVAKDGGLEWIEQPAIGVGPTPKIGVKDLVVYVHKREGGNWLGQSLLRPAYKFWLLKDRALRTQSQTIDRNGLGVPVYTASELPDTVTGDERTRRQQEEIEAGSILAQSFRAGDNSGAAIPATAKLELRGVDGTLPDADPVIRYYDEQIARAVLAHFLNLGTETGSWALGTTFADFFTLSLQTIGLHIANITSAYVVEQMVDYNFGPDEPAPRIVFDEIGSRHAASAEDIRALTQGGVIRADDELERHMRTTYGLPEADPDTAREAPQQASPFGQPPQPEAPPAKKADPDKKTPATKESP